MLVPTLNCFST